MEEQPRSCRSCALVVNPHKWLATPMDCAALYTSRPDLLKRAFQHVADYLVVGEGDEVVNLMDYGISLGRRFRALKLWFVIRNFGVDGLQAMIREHLRIAAALAKWIDDDPAFERLAEVNFSTVVFRHRLAEMSEDELNSHNAVVLQRVNGTRKVFLSHTRVRGKYALRIAIGNIHTTESDVRRALDLVRKAGEGR
jgi:aromatic-L-amino-acid/L-tryptophan decarboxylase